jgi:addiction module HigA family antidote
MNHVGIHPGAILQQEFLLPLGINPSALARAIGVRDEVVSAIIAGTAGISHEIAKHLATRLNTTPDFWMNLQPEYEDRQQDLAELTSEAQRLRLGY